MVVSVFCDLPIAVAGVIAVTKAGVAAHPVLQQEGPSLLGGVDLKAVSCKVGFAGLDALHRKERAAVERGTFLLEDGVCSYSGLGDGYNTGDCYWEITKNGDYTHDGIRELHFDAICYIPEDSIPYFSEKYITNTDSELYDFYTGMWLTTATAYGNSQRGDNYYLHTVSWQGNSYLIEFAYSTNWQYNVGDWAQVLTKSYAVYLPEDYDGLVFAAEAQPDNYKDSAKRMQLDSISPEASLMDIDTVDPYRSLYFSLCY